MPDYLTQINRTQEERELQLSPTDGQSHHNEPGTSCVSLFRANVSGFQSQPERLGQEASHTPPSFFGPAIQSTIKSKTPDEMFSKRHNSLKLADTWQHTVMLPLTSFSPSIPSRFPKCRLKYDESLYHESFKDTITFFKVTIQYRFRLDLAGP